MEVIRENDLFDALGKGRRVVAGVGTDTVADTGRDVARPGCRVAFSPFLTCLVDVGPVDNFLKRRVNFIDFFKGNAWNFETLARRQIDVAIAVFFRDFLNFTKVFCLKEAAGHPNS